MSVANSTSSIFYTGNNSTVSAYVVPFTFFETSDLVVVKRLTATGAETTLTETTDYVVTGGDGSTGSLVTVSAIPATYTVTIYREIPETQPLAYVEADDFPAASHEEALDRLTYICQQVSRSVAGSFRVTEASGSLSPVSVINNGIVGTNASGAAVMLTGAQVQTLLNLPGTVIDQPTKTFADAAARGAATPDFLGQVGVQLDTTTVYLGTSIAAGGWTVYNFTIATDSVSTASIQALAVTAAKLAADSVETAKIKDANVTAAKLASDSVETAKIKDANVTTAKLADASITSAKVSTGLMGKVVTTEYGTWSGYNVTMPYLTVPGIANGTQILSAAISPTSSTDKILARVVVPVLSANAADSVVVALFRGSVCIGMTAVTIGVAGWSLPCSIEVLDSPATTSSTTYSVRFGPVGANYAYVNGSNVAAWGGGAVKCSLVLTEVKA
jgi:hypothetical protein